MRKLSAILDKAGRKRARIVLCYDWKRAGTLTLSLFLFLTISAQTPTQDLEKINTTYTSANSWSMGVSVQLVQSSESKVVESYAGESKRDGSNYYSSFMGRTVVLNGHCSIIIDDNQSAIYYNEAENNQSVENAFDSEQLLASLETFESVEYEVQEEDYCELILLMPEEQPYEYMVLGYNPKTGIISKIIIQLSDSGFEMPYDRVEINYKNVKLNQRIDALVFSEKSYIKRRGNTVVPQDKYKDYQVIQNQSEY